MATKRCLAPTLVVKLVSFLSTFGHCGMIYVSSQNKYLWLSEYLAGSSMQSWLSGRSKAYFAHAVPPPAVPSPPPAVPPARFLQYRSSKENAFRIIHACEAERRDFAGA